MVSTSSFGSVEILFFRHILTRNSCSPKPANLPPTNLPDAMDVLALVQDTKALVHHYSELSACIC